VHDAITRLSRVWQGIPAKEPSHPTSTSAFGTESWRQAESAAAATTATAASEYQYTIERKISKNLTQFVFQIEAQNQAQQNGDAIQTQTQQIQIQQSGQTQQQTQANNQILARNVLMGNQNLQLQVLPDNTTWVKYEIIQSDQME